MSTHCPTCKGTGVMPGAARLTLVGVSRKKCTSCGGSGSVADVLLGTEQVVTAVFLFTDGTVNELEVPRRLAGKLLVTGRPGKVENVPFKLHHIDGDGVFHYEEATDAEKA